MSEREKLIQEYTQKKIAHDQQEEALRKSKNCLTQNDLRFEIRKRKSSKLITNSSHCNQSVKSLARFSKKSPKKNVLLFLS